MLGEIKIKYFNRGRDKCIRYETMSEVTIKFPRFIVIPISATVGSKYTCDDCELNIHKWNQGYLDTSEFDKLSPRCEHTYSICECADNMIIKPFTKFSLFIMSYIKYSRKILYIVKS